MRLRPARRRAHEVEARRSPRRGRGPSARALKRWSARVICRDSTAPRRTARSAVAGALSRRSCTAAANASSLTARRPAGATRSGPVRRACRRAVRRAAARERRGAPATQRGPGIAALRRSLHGEPRSARPSPSAEPTRPFREGVEHGGTRSGAARGGRSRASALHSARWPARTCSSSTTSRRS